jgi:hypothetical protein
MLSDHDFAQRLSWLCIVILAVREGEGKTITLNITRLRIHYLPLIYIDKNKGPVESQLCEPFAVERVIVQVTWDKSAVI